ncbi:uncharacterized protein LOC141898104 [Tubulanus polymorphus]|uniref:uncharacterized protein LOC141898104 n=1 Tax=Tubulanus polymorphus TaxID=672921 RepID=UPI003DA52A6F
MAGASNSGKAIKYEDVDQELRNHVNIVLVQQIDDKILETVKYRKTYPKKCKYYVSRQLRFQQKAIQKTKVQINKEPLLVADDIDTTESCIDSVNHVVDSLSALVKNVSNLNEKLENLMHAIDSEKQGRGNTCNKLVYGQPIANEAFMAKSITPLRRRMDFIYAGKSPILSSEMEFFDKLRLRRKQISQFKTSPNHSYRLKCLI